MLKVTDRSRTRKTPALIRARVHAYESAGSYAMEGMVGWLLGENDWALEARHKYEFYIMPMCNPDGVFNGMGRLTAPRGANLVWVPPTDDPAHTAIVAAMERVKPRLFIDLHNWQNKHTDGLLGLEPQVRDAFLRFMPEQVQFGKRWFIRDPTPPPVAQSEKETMCTYCRRVFGAVAVAVEFPWFARKPDDMRGVGANALKALLRAIDELEGDRTR